MAKKTKKPADFLDEMTAERTRKNPGFPALVGRAERKRDRQVEYALCPDCPKSGKRGCRSCGLTSSGRRIAMRRAACRELGLPTTLTVQVNLDHGVASFVMPGAKKLEYAYTMPDLAGGVNVDVSEDGRIFALEDLGRPMFDAVSGWFEALARAKAKLEAKAKKAVAR